MSIADRHARLHRLRTIEPPPPKRAANTLAGARSPAQMAHNKLRHAPFRRAIEFPPLPLRAVIHNASVAKLQWPQGSKLVLILRISLQGIYMPLASTPKREEHLDPPRVCTRDEEAETNERPRPTRNEKVGLMQKVFIYQKRLYKKKKKPNSTNAPPFEAQNR